MSKLIESINQFLFERVSAKPLAALRLVFGFYMVFYFIQARWILQLYFTDNAYSAHIDKTAPLTTFARSLVGLRTSELTYFWLLWGITLLVALMLGLGLLTRVVGPLLWYLNLCWYAPVSYGTNSGDQVVQVIAFLLAVTSVYAEKEFSLDAKIYKEGGDDRRMPSWALRLFQIQLCLLYFFSGFHKLSSTDWYQGSALHYVCFQYTWSRFDMVWLTEYPMLTGMATYATLFYELLFFPVLVWPRLTRGGILFLGLLLHISIAITMRVFVFGEIMPIFYICFLTPEFIECVRARLSCQQAPKIGHLGAPAK
jgi:hypothetical protein